MSEEYTPNEAHLVKGMAVLAGVFARVLETEHPGLRDKLELAASQAVRRFQDQGEHQDTSVLLLTFLGELHAQSLEGKT